MVDFFAKLRHANSRKAYKGAFLQTNMVGASRTDGNSWITITDGSLLDIKEFGEDERRPIRSAKNGDQARYVREEATANLLTHYARKLTHFRHYRTHAFNESSPAYAVPLDTWLLGPPKSDNALFAPWFGGEVESTDYRIFIHRSPVEFRGISLTDIWDGAYLSNRAKLPMKRKRIKNEEFKEIAYTYMAEQLFPAYRRGKEAVESEIGATGHTYFHHSVP